MPPKSKREKTSPVASSHLTKKTKLRTSPEAMSSTNVKKEGKSNDMGESSPQTAFVYSLARVLFY
jgi:hypothetical protein